MVNCYRDGDNLLKYQVKRNSLGFYINKSVFGTIGELVEHYNREAISPTGTEGLVDLPDPQCKFSIISVSTFVMLYEEGVLIGEVSLFQALGE